MRCISYNTAFVFLLLCAKIQSQTLPLTTAHAGGSLGLHLSMGTHVQRLGLVINFYAEYCQVQANTELRVYRNFRALGPRKRYTEWAIAQGLLFSYGPASTYFNPFFSAFSNQTTHANSIAYAYQLYFNKIGTTQQIGSIAAQFGYYTLLVANDVFARTAYDRFRTGALSLQYQQQSLWQARVNLVMWTGQMGRKHSFQLSAIPSGCYMDSVGGKFTNTSHGLLYAEFRYHPGFAQIAQVAAGVDADQIRNYIQNRCMHDQIFLPKKLRTYKNCHIPVLDQNQKLYLYQAGQKIRAAKLYLNAGLNEPAFY